MTVNYREVERTVEFDPIDGWVYRVVDTEYGVLVKRTAEASRPMWSHSILTQIYQPNANEFVPACRADNPWLADCNNLRDYELLRALSIEVAKAPEVKP